LLNALTALKMKKVFLAPPHQRNLQLDVLRGVAILLVLNCHSIFLQKPTWAAPLVRAGWSGVDLFFVVSGFLISGLLFSEYRKTGAIRFSRFAIRRAAKIYPAFYFTVLVLVVGDCFSHTSCSQDLWDRVLHDVFFLQSYRLGTSGHFWSLSVEEHFYILLPVALFFMMRRAGAHVPNPFRPIPRVFLSVALAVLAMRLLNAQIHPWIVRSDWQRYLAATHLRLDSLFFGVFISYCYHFHQETFCRFCRRFRWGLWIAAALLLSPLLMIDQYDRWTYTYGFTFAYLGYGCLLVAFLQVPVSALWRPVSLLFRAIGFIGTYSYSIYLWHLLTFNVISSLNPGIPSFTLIPMSFGAAIGVGLIAAKLVEVPVLRLRDRLVPRDRNWNPVNPAVERVASNAFSA